MGGYVVDLSEIDQTRVAEVGGKAAHLGELARIEGIDVPAGFCVTTAAFERILESTQSIEDLIGRLSRLRADDREAIRALSAEIRQTIESVTVPDDITTAMTRSLARLGAHTACAVRSSATAEDMPTASFAGQYDTYLNVMGPAAILQHVSRCWASLFTDRAVTYRLRNGLDHRKVHMAVVVQRMASSDSDAAGVLFTADPVTGNRTLAAIEATFGLGEALVSGVVNPDVYTVRDGAIVARTIATKQRAITASPSGGTQQQTIEPRRQTQPALTDAQAVRLAQLGRRIEAHFGVPQDIEWCLVGDGFFIVQSRPITTVFPIPERSDTDNHVYVSVGHGQMMTDAMKPLGISFWQLTAARPMFTAGGRLFVDVTRELASPIRRAGLVKVMGQADPLMGDALQTVIQRTDFIPPLTDEAPVAATAAGPPAPPIETDPAIVDELIRRSEASVATLKRDIRAHSGSALLDFILADLQELKRVLFDPQSLQVIMAGMEASWWLNDHMQKWLDEKSAADTLTQSVPHNVTSEMGLALLDVADVIRPHPDVVPVLQRVHAEDEDFLDELRGVEGGREARDAIQAWLDMYGMRCVGEIDITRPRWSERPAVLVPLLLSNIRNFEPGAARRRFDQGLQEARNKEQELLERLHALPDGEQEAAETKRMIDRVRTFSGYREYPKYGMISRYFVYKQALLEEAERLVQAHVLREREDMFYLTFQEFHDVVRAQRLDDQLVGQRKDAFRSYQALTPPRVLTSEGEAIAGAYRRDDVPAGALIGLAVSAGTVEGRARVVLDMAEADLQPGDILVTAYTDPSWTPLFVTIGGLVTEVGGLMTHGAVIAREYGVPAVVGVQHATQLLRDGQRIRVHGADGYVEILPDQ
ncbi:MAG: phosphoenolpyruvate synthase [Chloroflexi bacterium]|nr:phosphoenolpyruvate synthase [Chloroflexota bacterium]